MKISRKALRISALATAALAATVIALGSGDEGDHAIEGIWLSRFHCQCLCDSHNFFVFENGRIARYSDTHETDYSAGSYEELGAGLYQVSLHHQEIPDSVWEVRPGKKSWIAPPDLDQPLPQRFLRRFYRPRKDAKERALMASAPARDEKIREAIARLEAAESSH